MILSLPLLDALLGEPQGGGEYVQTQKTKENDPMTTV